LRERPSDIPLLINYFIEKFNTEKKQRIDGISPEALKCFMGYHWPGNVRELENIIERIVILRGEGKIEQEYEFPDLGEILNPTWSPDGRYIAFSALEGGFSNLFIYDLKDGKLQKMTDDPYAALQPAWSPDGKSIANT